MLLTVLQVIACSLVIVNQAIMLRKSLSEN